MKEKDFFQALIAQSCVYNCDNQSYHVFSILSLFPTVLGIFL